jgi:hypothetical protein
MIMRWILLSLPSALVLALVVYLSCPEAEPVEFVPRPVVDKSAPLAPEPIAVLEKCLAHYTHTVKGYRAILYKQERTAGKLHPPEAIQVYFQEKPFSVYLDWLKGARRAQRALYVAGQHDEQMLVRPTGFILGRFVVTRDPDGAEAREAGRYSIREFGIKKGTERTLAAWKRARAKGTLKVDYLKIQTLKMLDDRPCYVYRARYAQLEAGLDELTIYIDKETLLQVGSILKRDGKLVATYLFRAVKVNPTIAPDQFTRAAL